MLARRKTQTRRISLYEYREGSIQSIRDNYLPGPAKGYVKIQRKYKQKLGEITDSEIRAEGFNNLEDFKQAWLDSYGVWNPDQLVTAYEFSLVPSFSEV